MSSVADPHTWNQISLFLGQFWGKFSLSPSPFQLMVPIWKILDRSPKRNISARQQIISFSYYSLSANNTCVDAEDLNNLLQAIVTTSSQYGGFKAVKKSRNSTAVIWDFTGAFTFSVTIVTTIGKIYNISYLVCGLLFLMQT